MPAGTIPINAVDFIEIISPDPFRDARPRTPVEIVAAQQEVGADDLLTAPLVMMRDGYVMHRFVRRLLGDLTPASSFSADGAEMGKLMVAEGLGITVLPDFSVIDDPLERSGTITYRPLRAGGAEVLLVVQRRRSPAAPQAPRDLHRLLVARARASQPHA
jgi:DNA-binding transcriptional LysR family regulator